ncbi:TadE/TadG family type IV pilus assembly protein [Propionibacteriaceae bacterium G1746]|uniref:TadE/TadG family type IV pilus assembly protein n=1 Tax=Aestuariimicrobium sp. G57 TaxID=3418485 RepID=UPI003C1E499D
MRNHHRHRGERQRGAAAVEFALILPILIALLLGITEYGYRLYLTGSAAGAAREGARAMAISTAADKGSVGKVKAEQAFADTTGKAGTATPSTSTDGTSCIVTLSYGYPGLTGFFGSMSVSGTGEMRCGG